MAATEKQAENTTTPNHLPVDLFPAILSRLPVKSLLRFRCVSKPWLALVDDDSEFALLHLNSFKNNHDETRLFIVHPGIEYGRHIQECVVRCSNTFKLIPEIPLSLPSDKWDVVSSLHGLMLLEYRTNTFGHFVDLKVWNPSIRKLLEIPPLLTPEIEASPFLLDKDIGLGYDPVANNYKHVKLIYGNKGLHSVAIYALGADSWKITDFQGKGSSWHWSAYGVKEAVYFQRSLYFIARDKLIYGAFHLVWFDLSKEIFSSISMPDGNQWKLIDGGSSLVAFDKHSPDKYVRWALDSESMCWTKHGSYTLKGYLLHIKKNGDMWMLKQADQTGEEKLLAWGEVGLYSPETGEHKTRQLDYFISHVSCYVESLFLHKMN